MAPNNEGLSTRSSLGDGVASFELHLSRKVFARGRQLSGVVVLRLSRPVSIRSLVVTVTGAELASGAKLRGSIRGPQPFFRRDVLLSGRDRPKFIYERLSQYWNAFLRREEYRILSAGEYTYPFTLPLPGSLPPSCEGKAGRIVYNVAAWLNFPLGRTLHVSEEVPVAFSPGKRAEDAFVLSHSSVYGGKHATGADVSLELPSRSYALGGSILGKLVVSNPRRAVMKRITIDLEVSDGARAGVRGVFEPRSVRTISVEPEDSSGQHIAADFELAVPHDAPPSVEGTKILVAWSLNVTVDACPPLEFRMPVIVCMPVS